MKAVEESTRYHARSKDHLTPRSSLQRGLIVVWACNSAEHDVTSRNSTPKSASKERSCTYSHRVATR